MKTGILGGTCHQATFVMYPAERPSLLTIHTMQKAAWPRDWQVWAWPSSKADFLGMHRFLFFSFNIGYACWTGLAPLPYHPSYKQRKGQTRELVKQRSSATPGPLSSTELWLPRRQGQRRMLSFEDEDGWGCTMQHTKYHYLVKCYSCWICSIRSLCVLWPWTRRGQRVVVRANKTPVKAWAHGRGTVRTRRMNLPVLICTLPPGFLATSSLMLICLIWNWHLFDVAGECTSALHCAGFWNACGWKLLCTPWGLKDRWCLQVLVEWNLISRAGRHLRGSLSPCSWWMHKFFPAFPWPELTSLCQTPALISRAPPLTREPLLRAFGNNNC